MKQYYRQATTEEIDYYSNQLYPLQDKVLKVAAIYEQKIYLLWDFPKEARKLDEQSAKVLQRRAKRLSLPKRRVLIRALG